MLVNHKTFKITLLSSKQALVIKMIFFRCYFLNFLMEINCTDVLRRKKTLNWFYSILWIIVTVRLFTYVFKIFLVLNFYNDTKCDLPKYFRFCRLAIYPNHVIEL